MKVVNINFGRTEKTPKIIEDKLNKALLEGKFQTATQIESPTTGRLYISLYLKENSEPDTQAKVFREISESDMTQKMNAFLEGADLRHMTQTVSSKSNALITTLFFKKKA